MKHTKEPWEYANTDAYSPETFDIFESSNARTIARTVNGPKEIAEANAKLICQAPVLFSALKGLVDAIASQRGMCTAYDNALAALEKGEA